MHRIRWNRLVTVLSLLSVSAVIGAGITAAADDNRPDTDIVAATFTGKVVHNQTVTCTGRDTGAQDAKYAQSHTTYSGTFMSSDPRLNGPFTADTHSLANLVTGYGTETGELTIWNAKTGHATTHAHIYGVIKGNDEYGFLSGNTERSQNGTEVDQPGLLFANFTAKATGTTTFAGQLGSMDNTSHPGSEPAVIQSGQCSGDVD